MASPFWSPSFFLPFFGLTFFFPPPAFPERTERERTEGAELRGGDSTPEVHGGRGCPPPRSQPGSEGRSWGPAEAAEGAGEAAAAQSVLRTAEAVPRSLQQLSTRCGAPQTDWPSEGTACPPPPGPSDQLPHFRPPSLQTPFSLGVLRGKKNIFLKLQNQTRLERQSGVGGREKKVNFAYAHA